ncbi:MAG TPA: hypothetical protein PKM94_06740 [candidate division Zixibacteria bacterium]|nr:hypothetical protein [candidate division Zixibacteria bacterium]MDD4916336.1 hypothetical protein [candidate division Zixibacteria bacterium]MDM7971852.1 hypothetical protein [candidate division Zixibacteria bacterium]HOD66374.1 hypothetical protein [candidate division Zixibacteria bacterium]HPC10847.1 hypothetical protein [candidate division Zixibacteria bacterium]
MQRVLIVLSALAVFLLLPLGCSDDESCADCPATPAGFVDGSITVNPQAIVNAVIYGYGGIVPSIDSIRLGDSLMTRPTDYNWFQDAPGRRHWQIGFSESAGGSFLYSSGDVARLEIWGPGRQAVCDVVMLDPRDSEAQIISPVPGEDTVAPGESVTIVWQRIEHAQFYALMLTFFNRANAVTRQSLVTDWTADTSYTVRPVLYPDSLQLISVELSGFTGPNPSVGSNFSGGWLTGRLISFSAPAHTFIWGWNAPDKARAEFPDEAAVSAPRSPAEIIDAIYRQAVR